MGEININIFPLGNGPCFTQRIFSGQVFHPNKLLTNGNSDNNKKPLPYANFSPKNVLQRNFCAIFGCMGVSLG